jgi:hypothetical protein
MHVVRSERTQETESATQEARVVQTDTNPWIAGSWPLHAPLEGANEPAALTAAGRARDTPRCGGGVCGCEVWPGGGGGGSQGRPVRGGGFKRSGPLDLQHT